MLATIQWFDATSGEGMAITEDGESLYVHFSTIKGIDKHNYQWPTEADQTRLKGIEGMKGPVTVYRNLYSAQVETIDLGLGICQTCRDDALPLINDVCRWCREGQV